MPVECRNAHTFAHIRTHMYTHTVALALAVIFEKKKSKKNDVIGCLGFGQKNFKKNCVFRFYKIYIIYIYI